MKKRKITGRKTKKDESEACDFPTYSSFNRESDEPFGMVREGGDGQASPDNEWPDISDVGDLPLTLHSVPVGGDKSNFGSELGGITERISKLLHEYESVYDNDNSTQSSIGDSVTGQIYIENLLSDYHSLCQEREKVLESLQDSLDLDEEEILDRLEKMSKRSKDDIEGSESVVKKTFEEAKQNFERLKVLNREKLSMLQQGQDISTLEQERDQLQEELLMYKRMALQQKLGSISKSRKKSLLKKDESQQWKLVAGEMLDIVKNIKLEGLTDKIQLEKDLNMILVAMNALNEQIEKLNNELAASELSVKRLHEEKSNIQQQKTTKEKELKDMKQEIKNGKVLIKKLEEENEKLKSQNALARQTTEAKIEVKEEFKRPEPVDDIIQAQLRDQKNKASKLEEQNKELLTRIETYEKEEKERKEREKTRQEVSTSREEISLLSSKAEQLEQQLASLREQLTKSQEELDNVRKSQLDFSKRTEVIGEASSDNEEATVMSREQKKSKKPTGKPKPKRPAETRKKPTEVKKTSSVVRTHDDDSKSEEKVSETVEETRKEEKIETILEMGKLDVKLSDEEQSSYLKVGQTKMATLCDRATQTGYKDRLESISMGNGRDSFLSWKGIKNDRRDSLADAIKSIAPPNVVGQETAMVTDVINEEVDRLCDDICGLVEYGYDLIEQEEKMLQSHKEKHLDEEDGVQEPGQGLDQSIRTGSDRRQSVYSDVLLVGDLPQPAHSDAFPSRDRRLSIHSDAFPVTHELRQIVQADQTRSRRRKRITEETGAMKRQILKLAEAAINIIKDTGDAFTYRLNEKARHKSINRDPIAGKRVVSAEQDRSLVSKEGQEQDIEETDVLFPLFGQEIKGMHTPADPGLIMINTATKSEPQTAPPQLSLPRKRGKPKAMTRQQQMMKQKALLAKARYVEAMDKDTHILKVLPPGQHSPSLPHRSSQEGKHKAGSSINKTFNLPFIATGIAKTEEQTVKKNTISRRLSTVENVQKPSYSFWNGKQGILKYYSANDVPGYKPDIKALTRGKAKAKLPNLNISHLFGSL